MPADPAIRDATLDALGNLPPESLLTRAGGPVEISQADRQKIAVFAGGTALVTPDARWSPLFKSVREMAARAGHPVREIHEVDPETIAGIGDRAAPPAEIAAASLQGRQKELADLIARAAALSASDIQVRVLPQRTHLRVRVHGHMQALAVIPASDGMALIRAAFAVASDTSAVTSDFADRQGALTAVSGLLPLQVEMIRLQYVATTQHGGALVMRLKYRGDHRQADIDGLGYAPRHVRDIAVMRRRTNGLYIFSGKVSSGKSTTLQRALNRMLEEKNHEISMFTVEEPVELDIPGAIQVNVRPQPDGSDGFVAAMKSLLRSDPNVIVMGEIRGRETAEMAIQAVMSGHAVWSTIHAGSALGILDRLVDLGVETWRIAEPTVTRGLVYQRLVGVICPACRIDLRRGVGEGQVDRELAGQLVELLQREPERLHLRGPGCPRCRHGLVGRTVVAETIEVEPKLLELFAEGRRADMRRHWLKPEAEGGMGGVPVLHHALAKVGAGLLDINEVEGEVDLLSVYRRDFLHLAPRLRRDVAELLGEPR